MNRIKTWARKLKKQIFILYLAYKDRRVSWYARLFTLFVVAYAFSPIDLIPDFIPVLGYLDDIILVPLGIWLALKMLPEEVVKDCTVEAERLSTGSKPRNWVAGIIIILVWISLAWWCWVYFFIKN